MINNKKVLAIIPARGGSKGVPRKNIIDIHGKPLLFYTFKQAQESEYIDRVILSSEDQEIIEIAKDLGCEVPFERPAELASDKAGTMPVIFHALDQLEESYDYIVLLQVTSPLRTTEDIDRSIELCEEKNSPACVSVVETDKPPHWMFNLDEDNAMKPILTETHLPKRRQDAPNAFIVNGAVFVAQTDWIKTKDHFISDQTIAYVMPKSRSLDIDTEDDIILLKHRNPSSI